MTTHLGVACARASTRHALQAHLARAGFVVIAVRNTSSLAVLLARHRAGQTPLSALILSPSASGGALSWEALERLHLDEHGVPVVLLTPYTAVDKEKRKRLAAVSLIRESSSSEYLQQLEEALRYLTPA